MSIIKDDLFAENLAKLKEIKQALNNDKNDALVTLGTWLDNALSDDNNNDLRKLFIDNAENKKYLTKQHQRDLTKRLADNLTVNDKVKDSNHAQNIAKNNDNETLPNTSTQRSKILTLKIPDSTLRTTTPDASAQTKVGMTKFDSLKCSAIKLDR